MGRLESKRPAEAVFTTTRHKVAFYETDAMGVVHHANYVFFLEDARTDWFEQHGRSYAEYVKMGRHFAVTCVEIEYLRPARYNDSLEIRTTLLWVGGASARFVYEIFAGGELLVTAATEHALIDEQGRLRRIPPEWRQELLSLSAQGLAPVCEE